MASDSELMISRIIKAPRAAVWRAWAEPLQFAKWWIPAPWICRVVKMDLQPGGGFETLMAEPGKEFQPHLDACFLDVVPMERIVFTTVLREGWQPCEAWLAMTGIMTMQDEGAHTRYVARALHKGPEDSQKHAEMGFDEGWGMAIDQLEAVARAF
jgi:uncharacterized protein YndB with AHSA1/START domain